MKIRKINTRLVNTKTVFILSLIVVILAILAVWLFGLGNQRTVYENSILSTSILSASFFLFITIGLYKGIKLKDNLGEITDKINLESLGDLPGDLEVPEDIPDLGDGIGGVILGILAWIAFTIIILVLIWIFSTLLWTMILIFSAILYWIFFRALRLIFKNSKKCERKFGYSVAFGLGYTTLYNFWIYGIILASHYLY